MTGPYFSGQQPAPCGHYYPDVLRLRDEKRRDGAFVRIMDCSYCGKYELPLDARTLDKELARKLEKQGFDIGVKEEEISIVREKELERLSSEAMNKTRAFVALQSILEEAINAGADSVEMEYVTEGLEVTYMFGNRGHGSVLKDKTLESGIIGLIIERAKLQDKSRGVMEWAMGDKAYRIKVEEYESFGESAFRLILEKSKRGRA